MTETLLVRTCAIFALTNKSHGPTKLYFNNQDTFASILRDLWEEWEVRLSHSDVWLFPDGTAYFFRDLQYRTFESLHGVLEEGDKIYIMMSSVDPPRDPTDLVYGLRDGEFTLFLGSDTVVTEDIERFKLEFQQMEIDEDNDNLKSSPRLLTPPRNGTVTPTSQELTLHVHYGTVSLQLQMGQSQSFYYLLNLFPIEWSINTSCALFHGNTRLAWEDTPYERHFVGGEHVGVVGR